MHETFLDLQFVDWFWTYIKQKYHIRDQKARLKLHIFYVTWLPESTRHP